MIPEGWKLVPVEPTPAMTAAFSVASAELTKRHLLSGSYPATWQPIEAGYRAMLDAASAPPVQGTVPKGWKLVPVEPTPEMLAAAHEGDTEYTLRNFGDVMTVSQGPYDHYVAMLDAAPTPPFQAQPLYLPEPMTPNDINLAARAELAGLLDHIYEYGTMSEGVMSLAVTFARAIEAETLRRIKEVNK